MGDTSRRDSSDPTDHRNQTDNQVGLVCLVVLDVVLDVHSCC